MYSVPSGERIHIGIFGKTNAGKSSLLNAISAQESAMVSDVPGTTTDPVRRVMEILPLGPVVLYDTPGLADTGELGDMRKAQTYKVLSRVHMALVVLDGVRKPDAVELGLIADIRARKLPYIVVYNKCDTDTEGAGEPENGKSVPTLSYAAGGTENAPAIAVSAKTGYHIRELKERMAGCMSGLLRQQDMLADLIRPGDLVILVVPIDSAAPKGRLILPQQMALREVLDCHAQALVVQDTELSDALATCHRKPALVVTDSQAFHKVVQIVPEDIALTSFSILMARKKGGLKTLLAGADMLDHLQDGGRILICEGCTHHRQCDDIGTVKMPAWIQKYSHAELTFTFTSGNGFPEDLSSYALIVHCGGCMLGEQEIAARQQQAVSQDVPMTNYGMAIAKMNGILDRSLLHGVLRQ